MATRDVFLCDAVRTPIGRYAGALAKVRTDDLAAVPLKALMARNPKIDWEKLDDVFFGCANQAGEDNRNVARMALLLAGLPRERAGRDAQSAVRFGARRGRHSRARNPRRRDGIRHCRRRRIDDARALRAGQGAGSLLARGRNLRHDDRLAFHQSADEAQYGVDAMPETGENVAEEFQVTRADQDAFALRSQQRAGKAIAAGYFAKEIVPVEIAGRKGETVKVDKDEHPRPDTTLEQLAKLKTPFRNPGTVTAGNASGVNDGAAALILASEAAVKAHGLTPRARILGMASAAVPPRIMGIGPVPSTRKLMARLGQKIGDYDLIEINEAFASQSLACLRQLGLADDAEHVNPHGGAIALGHPLGMSGARLALTAAHGLEERGGKLGAGDHVRRRRSGRVAGLERWRKRSDEKEQRTMSLIFPKESLDAFPKHLSPGIQAARSNARRRSR